MKSNKREQWRATKESNEEQQKRAMKCNSAVESNEEQQKRVGKSNRREQEKATTERGEVL